METLKLYLFNRFKIFYFVTVSISFSLFLLMLRIKITHSFFLIFLVWNLFLAIIPYSISLYLESRKHVSGMRLIIFSTIWLLFLPNAPYLVTDLIHLQISSNSLFLLDTLIIVAFAFSGLVLYYLSITDMLNLFKNRMNKHYLNFVRSLLFLLSAFGVYLGRFLRYNSWEIIQNPFLIIYDIFLIIANPKAHYIAWLFTVTFAASLLIGYVLFNRLNIFKRAQN